MAHNRSCERHGHRFGPLFQARWFSQLSRHNAILTTGGSRVLYRDAVGNHFASFRAMDHVIVGISNVLFDRPISWSTVGNLLLFKGRYKSFT